MPTAAEHRAEATSLTDLLDTLRVVRSDLVRDRDDLGVRGGTTRFVTWAIDATVTGFEELGRTAAAIVDELHRRAALCDQYTADLQRYDHTHRRWTVAVQRYHARVDTDHPTPWPGVEPLPPAVPFPGALAG